MMLSLLLCVLVALTRAEIDQHIVGGEVATYGDHPYICSLQQNYYFGWFHICGSVIYNRNSVITAAHCVDGKTATNLRVVCGNHVLSQTDAYQQTIGVISYTMHPGWDSGAPGYPNDIAIMRLKSSLNFGSHVNSINFASSGSFVGQRCKLSGWGLLEGGGSSANTLKKVNMEKISNWDCSQKWVNVSGAAINDGHICFFEEGKSACNGDSGGPVRCGDTLTGVTSWGISSCDGSHPSVYTRISYFYDWIVSNAF